MSNTKIIFNEDRKLWNISLYANQKSDKNVKKEKVNLRLIVKHIIKNRDHQTIGKTNKFFKGLQN